MKTQTQNYIVREVLKFFTQSNYKVIKMSSDYRSTTYSKSKLRVSLDSSFKKTETLQVLGRVHSSLLKITVKGNQLTFYFSKNYTKLRKPKKTPILFYGINEQGMKLVECNDKIEVRRFINTSIGKIFSIIKIGVGSLFLQSEKTKKRTSLSFTSLQQEPLKLI